MFGVEVLKRLFDYINYIKYSVWKKRIIIRLRVNSLSLIIVYAHAYMLTAFPI